MSAGFTGWRQPATLGASAASCADFSFKARLQS
jgi:hypothetical protein